MKHAYYNWILSRIYSFLMELVSKTKVNLKLGLVQTAYANGASTDYIQGTLNVPVACTPTGVKYLHHRAQEFDVGVYFEANGHGTVVFSENAKQVIRATANNKGWVCHIHVLIAVTHARGLFFADWTRKSLVRRKSFCG